MSDPTEADMVCQVRRGLRRTIGRAPRRPARPLSVADGSLMVCQAAVLRDAPAGSLITSARIKDNTIRSRDIHDGTIKVKDVSASTKAALRGPRGLRGPKGPAGAIGPPGVAGPVGPRGVAGAAGLSGYEIVYKTLTFPPYSDNEFRVHCPAGKRLLGGFAPITNFGHYPDQPDLFRYYVVDGGGGLAVDVVTVANQKIVVEAELVCANIS